MSSNIILSVGGQIISCNYDEGYGLFAKYTFFAGPEWSLTCGVGEGITQVTRSDLDGIAKWGFPIEIVYQSAKPFGWPQIVLAVYGSNLFGAESVVGYGAIHIPMQPGHHEFNVPLFARSPPSSFDRFLSFFKGSLPETISVPFLASGESRDLLKTESSGYVTLSFDVVLAGLAKNDLITTDD